MESDMGREDKLAASMFLSMLIHRLLTRIRSLTGVIQIKQFCRFNNGINKVHQITSIKGKTQIRTPPSPLKTIGASERSGPWCYSTPAPVLRAHPPHTCSLLWCLWSGAAVRANPSLSHRVRASTAICGHCSLPALFLTIPDNNALRAVGKLSPTNYFWFCWTFPGSNPAETFIM